MKPYIYIMTALMGTMLAQASYAQSDLTCPNYTRSDGIPETTLPDTLEPPIAHPGAFGGAITCVLLATEAGTLGYFSEVLPTSDTYYRYVNYRHNRIESYFGATGESAELVATCERDVTEEIYCETDIFIGKGFKILRVFGADLELQNVFILAIPSMGLFNVPDTSDPIMRSEVILSLPELPQPVTLPILNDFIEGQITYGIYGQSAYNFMVALYGSNSPLEIELNVYRTSEDQQSTYSQQQTILAGNHKLLINHLGEIEQLVGAGYEASKAFNFH